MLARKFKQLWCYLAVIVLGSTAPGAYAETQWDDANVSVYFIDYANDGVADDILLELPSRDFTLPYDVNVTIPAMGSSVVLQRNADGSYSVHNLDAAHPYTGNKTVASDISLKQLDLNGDHSIDFSLVHSSGLKTLVYLDAAGRAFVANTVQVASFGDAPYRTYSYVESHAEPATIAGVTRGQLTVSSTGQASYSLPIAVPAGVNGHQPALSINYSSGAGNGLLGKGWGLSGFTTITRCSSAPAFGDSATNGVKLDDEDKRCLNGQRLQPGPDGYHTEVDTLQRVIDNNSNYKIINPDSSYQLLNGFGYANQSNSHRAWTIQEAVDKYASKINYSYFDSSNSSVALPNTITYADAQIKFELSNGRNDLPAQYMGGKSLKLDAYLSGIKISVAGKAVTDYQLHYKYSGTSGDLLLTEIQQCVYDEQGQHRDCLIPLIINYAEESLNFVEKPSPVSGEIMPDNIASLRSADWNNDGLMDLIAIDNSDKQAKFQYGATNGLIGALEKFAVVGAEHYLVTPYYSETGERGVLYLEGSYATEYRTYSVLVADAQYQTIPSRTDHDYDYGCQKESRSVNGVDSTTIRWSFSFSRGKDEYGRTPTKTCHVGSEYYWDGLGQSFTYPGHADWYYPSIRIETAPAQYREETEEIPVFRFTWKHLKIDANGVVSNTTTALSGQMCKYPAGFMPEKDFYHPIVGDFDGDSVLEVILPTVNCTKDKNWTNSIYWKNVLGSGAVTYQDAFMQLNTPFSFDGKKRTYTAERVEGKFRLRAGVATELQGTILKTVSGSEVPSNQSIFVDLNGDGLSDILSIGQSAVGAGIDNNFIYIYRNTGGKYEDPRGLYFGQVSSLSNDALSRILDLPHADGAPISDRIRIGDYDGNGMPDIYILNGPNPANAAYANHFLVMRSIVNDDKQIIFEFVDTGIVNANTTQLQNRVLVYDADGDGRTDILMASGSRYQLFGQTTHFGDKVRSFSNTYPSGENLDATIEYRRMNDNAVYAFNTNYQENFLNFGSSMPLVYKIFSSAPNSATEETSYFYSNGSLNLVGRGFLGFDSVTKTEVLNKRQYLSNYRKSFPYIGWRNSYLITNTENGKTIAAQYDDPGVRDVTSQIKQVYNEKSRLYAFDLEGNRISKTVNSLALDSYGYSDFETMELQDASDNPQYRQFRDYDYKRAFPTFLDELSSSQTVFGLPSDFASAVNSTQHAKFINATLSGLPYVVGAKVTGQSANAFDEYTERYNYATGNEKILLSVSQSNSYSIPATAYIGVRTTQYSDYKSGVPTHVVNALKHETISGIDHRNSQPLWIKNADGGVVNYRYDGLGRVISMRAPQGSASTTHYQFCGGAANCPDYAVNAVLAVHTQSNDDTRATTYLDKFGNTVAQVTNGFNGEDIIQTTRYDDRGRVVSQSSPYCQGAGCDSAQYTATEYDATQSRQTVTLPDGSSVTTYTKGTGAGTEVIMTTLKLVDDPVAPGIRTVAGTQVTKSTFDIRGQLIGKTEDAEGKQVSSSYLYDSKGRLIFSKAQSLDGSSQSTRIDYDDLLGSKTLHDPDSGKTVSYLNRDGLVTKEIQYGLDESSGAIRTTTYSYDLLGRLLSRNEIESKQKYTWTYDVANTGESCGIGRLCEVSGPLFSEAYQYETYRGLLKTTTTQLRSSSSGSPKIYRFDYDYDSVGRTREVKYPSGLTVENTYQNGYTAHISDTNQILWSASQYDAMGHVRQATLGNGLTLGHGYDELGRLTQITAGVGASQAQQVQNNRYGYDSSGNLAYRKNNLNEQLQVFGYDGLNRLTNQTTTLANSTPVVKAFAYDDFGNLLEKTGITDYRYDVYSSESACQGSNHIATPGPHAVREANGQTFCYDKFGNQVNAGDRQVVYNADNLPTQVTKGTVSYQYLYDPNGDRFYQRKQSGDEVTETFYLAGGLYEEDIEGGVTTLKSYVGDFLIDKRVGEQVTQVYTLRDHLGSVEAIVDADVSDDLQASVLERMSYEAFGERAEDTRPAGTTAPAFDDRGFTDHEHMDDVGLIHMNGRVYDPVVGRFLSPDPYVQAPYNSQSYNRYSYVWNNPLSATDPSGYAGVTILLPITVYADDAAGYTLTYSSSLQSVDAEQARLDQIAGNSPFGPSLQPDLSRVDQVGLNWALTRASSDPSLFNDVASRISVAQLHLGERIANFNGKVSVDAARYYREEVGRAVEDFACTIGDCGAVAVEPDRIALEWTIGGKMFSGLLGVARSLEARVVTNKGWKGPCDYSCIADPKNLVNTKPTPRQVSEMKRLNREHNDGLLRSDMDGTILVDSKKSMRGVTPPSNEAQIDHILSVDKGGTRTSTNLQILSRQQNRDKWNN